MILGIINGGLGLKLAGGDGVFVIAYSVVAGVMFVAYLAVSFWKGLGWLCRVKRPREDEA